MSGIIGANLVAGRSSGLIAAVVAESGGGFTLFSEVATTSGTSAQFTGIGSGVKVIKIVFELVSFSGSNDEMEIQIGDAGGLETSGYSRQYRLLRNGWVRNRYGC